MVRSANRRLGVVARVEELLPLAHHAQVAIVHDCDFNGEALLFQGGQFLDIHLDTTIASYDPDWSIRHTHFDAHCSREGKAHGAKPTGGNMAIGAGSGGVAGGATQSGGPPTVGEGGPPVFLADWLS